MVSEPIPLLPFIVFDEKGNVLQCEGQLEILWQATDTGKTREIRPELREEIKALLKLSLETRNPQRLLKVLNYANQKHIIELHTTQVSRGEIKLYVNAINIEENWTDIYEQPELLHPGGTESFENVFENAPFPIAITSITTHTFVRGNTCFHTYCGYQPEETKGKSVLDLKLLQNEDDREKILDIMVRKGSVTGFTVALQSKTGTPQLGKIYINKIQYEHLPCLLIIILDLTAAEKAKADLLLSEQQRYKMLFEKASDGIILINENRFVACNEKICQLFRTERNDILNKTPFDFSPPIQPNGEASESFLIEKINEIEGDKAVLFEWMHLNKYGQEVPVEVSLSRLYIDEEEKLLAVIRDLRPRYEQDKKLKERESKFQAIFEQAPIGIMMCRFGGDIMQANNAFTRIIGYSREELKTMNIADFSLPDECHNDDILNLSATDTQHSFPEVEKCYLHKDGSNIDVLLKVVIVKDAAGSADYILAMAVDISHQKKIALDLTRYRKITDVASDIILIINPKNEQIVDCNATALNSLKYNRKSLLTMQLKDLEADHSLKEAHLQIKEFKSRQNFEKQKVYRGALKQKDGVKIPVAISIAAKSFGKEHYVIAIARNIKEQVKFEKKLKEQQELLENINQNINSGIFRYTSNKGFDYANKSLARLFGFNDAKEILSLKTSNMGRYVASHHDMEHVVKELMQHRHIQNKELAFIKQSGEQFWGLLNCILFIAADGNLKIDGAIIDISDLKESEQLLYQKNKELKKINTELDRFVYSASHDLRAPLTSLLGLVNIAKLDDDRKKMDVYLDLMHKSIFKLDTFLKDIINYSRNSRLDLNIEAFSLALLIEEAIASHQYLKSFSRINFKIKMMGEKICYTDRRRLNIVIHNLIANAIHYHDLEKTEPYVFISANVNKTHIRIEVEDNGQGIDEKYQKKIFDMFYRASYDSEGSGLGLYIVKETIERLKGTILLNSKPGLGSTFTLNIKNFYASKKAS